jgi:endoglucanase
MARRGHEARTLARAALVGAAILAATMGSVCAKAQQSPQPPYRPEPGIRLNTVGYLPESVKRATVAGAAKQAAAFSVVSRATGKVVLTGKLSAPHPSPDSGEEVRTADFTSVKAPGEYVLRVAGLPDSPPFPVRRGVYNASLRLVMLGFYGQRCGVPAKLTHNGITYEKGACHLQDGYLDYYDPAQAGKIKDGTGGWHDAGDYGKYVVNAAFATGIMLAAWEHYGDKLAKLELPIPEAEGPLPDYLAEVKFNLDWLLKMQFPDGRVSHKLTSLRFCPMIMPEADLDKRYFVPWGTDATVCLAAVAAQAARVFEPFDAAYAARCRAAAEQALGSLRGQWLEVQPDQSAFRTGTYVRTAESDRLWARLELWETTGENRSQVERSLIGDNPMVDVDWDWSAGKNLGIYAYLLSKRERDPVVVEGVKRDLIDAVDRIVQNHDRHGYGRGLRRYYWGVNGGLARLSLNLLIAHRLTGNDRYRDVALEQLAYLYGRNPYGRSFVTGEGHNPPRFPHHRPSAADGIDAPWPGHLVGGGHPTELDWHDVTPDAPTNENAINWDASLAYALAAFYDPAAAE